MSFRHSQAPCAIADTLDTNAMTFEEIEAHAKDLFSKKNDVSLWPLIDEGDRNYWRKMAIEELKGRPQTDWTNPPLDKREN